MSANAEIGRRRGWYHGWNIVAVAIFAQIAGNGLTVNAFSLFLHDWSVQLHTTDSTLQLGLAGMGLGSALLSPFFGVLADKYPARRLFVIGLTGMAIFHFGISLVTATWQFIALFALLLPPSLVLSTALVANAVVSRWFVRRLGLALGLTAFGMGAAGAVVPFLIAVLMPALGWRMVWRAAAVIIAFGIIPAVLLVVRDRPSERDGLYYVTGERDVLPHHGAGGASTLGWRDILGRRNFWLLVVAYLPVLAMYGGCTQNLAPIVTSRGFSPQVAGVFLTVFGFTYVASSLSMGILADRFGSRLPLFGLTLATAAGGLVVAVGHSVAVLGLGVVLVGISGGLWPLLAAAVAMEFGAGAVGRAFGMLTLFVPAIVLAPFIVAKAHEATGSYGPGLAALAALTGLGGCACLLMRERGRGGGAGAQPALAPVG